MLICVPLGFAGPDFGATCRNCEEALQVLQQAISIDPVNPLAKLRMAMALQFMERYEEVSAPNWEQHFSSATQCEAFSFFPMACGVLFCALGLLSIALFLDVRCDACSSDSITCTADSHKCVLLTPQC